MNEKVIGILGGMGPYATIDFMRILLDITPAKKDWDHIRTIVDSNTKLPSRTRAIVYNEKSPYQGMLESCLRLEKYPVDAIVIPCNSASYWVPDLQKKIDIPIISIINSTVSALKENKSCKRVVVFGAMTTFLKKLYKDPILEEGIDYIDINEKAQNFVIEIIELIKMQGILSELIKKKFVELVSYVKEREEFDALILGCTELSIFKDFKIPDVVIFDSSSELAKHTLSFSN